MPYPPDLPQRARELARLKVPVARIAAELGVPEPQVYLWLGARPGAPGGEAQRSPTRQLPAVASPAPTPAWQSRFTWITLSGVLFLVAAIAMGVTLFKTDGDPQGVAAPATSGSSPSVSATATPRPTATPTTTPKASTTPKPAGPGGAPTVAGCAAAPSKCGLPDATNTGVPAGTKLIVVNGDQKITKAGAVIEGRHIKGCVRIYAKNVTIRRTKISCGGYYGIFSYSGDYSGGGLLIEDVEIDCGGNNTTGIASYGFVARRVNVHGCENGFAIDENATVEQTYMHDFFVGAEGHTDGVQLSGGPNVIIRNNTIMNLSDGGTSAIISPDDGIANVLISGNLMAGGAYTLYCPRNSSSNFRVINNRISTAYSGKGGAYGPWVYCHDVAEVHGNVWDADLRPLE